MSPTLHTEVKTGNWVQNSDRCHCICAFLKTCQHTDTHPRNYILISLYLSAIKSERRPSLPRLSSRLTQLILLERRRTLPCEARREHSFLTKEVLRNNSPSGELLLESTFQLPAPRVKFKRKGSRMFSIKISGLWCFLSLESCLLPNIITFRNRKQSFLYPDSLLILEQEAQKAILTEGFSCF